MVKALNIIKDGIHNVVDEDLYNARYKPMGWKVADKNWNEVIEVEATAIEEIKAVDTTQPTAEAEIKNISAMQRKKKQSTKFNDNLIKQ